MRIPLYSLFTPSHRVLKEQFFEPTVPSDVELRLRFLDMDGAGFIQDPSWRRAILCKVELILEALDRHRGDVFAYTDVDVQFFGSFAAWFHDALSRNDLVFQTDAPGPALCAGFFFCRANDVTRALWQQVLEQVRVTEAREDDQQVAGRLVWKTPGLRFDCLSPVFFGGGTLTGRGWVPGDTLQIPRGLLMHHANFTAGIGNKVRQLEHVRELVQRDEFIPLADACARIRPAQSNQHDAEMSNEKCSMINAQ
jgi:Nucleotide-diphospho-sugar transferase